MTNNLDLLNNLSNMHDPMKSSVHLPNGKNVSVQYQGRCHISNDCTIENVLYVPDFKYNLMSVSKMTKELQCSVLFFPYFCVFQDLCTGKVRGIGKEEGGLYLLLPRASEKVVDKRVNASSNVADITFRTTACLRNLKKIAVAWKITNMNSAKNKFVLTRII